MAIPEVVKELLENGVHFGHLSKHWNPKMKRFIFGKKKNIYIIDLEKTAQKLEEAKEFSKTVVEKGDKILFVATKRQLREVVKELASSCDMPYVVERWVGGFLTNFPTIKQRIKRYTMLIEKRDEGKFNKMPRKEVVRLNREIERMERNYSGVTALEGLPSCIFVVDPKREVACIREANKLAIPIIALIDTDADPEAVDYPIPGNDDAMKSVKYITSCIVEAVKEGLKKVESLSEAKASKEEKEQEAEEADSNEAKEKASTDKKRSAKKRSQQKED